MLRSRVSLLTWNAIVAFSEQYVAKLVHGVATLLSSSLCTSTLAIGSCKSEKRAAKLHLHVAVQLAINLWTSNF